MSIEFASAVFDVKPITSIEGHRLFDADDPKDPNIESIKGVKEGVLYYAREKETGGRNEYTYSHPWADIWFRTTSNQIILIDVFGGQNEKTYLTKVKKLQNLIDHLMKKPELEGLAFEGVVLAPGFPGSSTPAEPGKVHRVLGDEARGLLGGLGQVYRWSK